MTDTLTIIAFLAMLAIALLGCARISLWIYDETRNARKRSPIREWRREEWWR